MKLYIPDLNRRQLDKLSDISSDLALVSVASIVLPAVFDKYDTNKIIIGAVITIIFWGLSIWIKK